MLEIVSLDTSFAKGQCVQCGKKVPGVWPSPDGKPPDSWSLCGNEQVGVPLFLVCGECEREIALFEEIFAALKNH